MKYVRPLFIIEAKRSPIGRLGGGLASLPAAELALQLAHAVVPETLRDAVGEVVLGQVLQAGAGMNVARQVGLRLGLPQSSPAWTVNMACASGLKAVALAAQGICHGDSGLALAGGVESMSRAPHYLTELRPGKKLGDSALVDAVMADGLSDPVLKIGMGETAERIAEKFRLTREEQDDFALGSQQRAAENAAAFRRETVAIQTKAGMVEVDEHPRPDTTRAGLARLKPAFRGEGTVTAGNSSGINDGAALLLLADEVACRGHGLRPRARLVASCEVGCDPAMMGLGPIGAIRKVLGLSGWDLGSVDAFEINEAFAAQTLACARELQIPGERLNRRGGAIALGHPIGASGARVLVTLLHLMEDHGLKRGIASLCVGGGMGIALAIER